MPSTKSLKLAAFSFAFGVFAHPLQQHGLVGRSQQQHLDSTDSYTLVNGTNGVWPYRKYMTTNATSPEFIVQRNGQAIAPGSLFMTLSNLLGTGENWQGALIMSSDGDLVWAGPEGATSNLRKQTYMNETVVTTWTGDGSAAAAGGASHGYGQVQIYNSRYEVIQTVCPTATDLDIQFSPGTTSTCVCDVHESYITEDNTMLVTVYNLTQTDLTSVGGPKDGWITNSLFVEVNIETSKALFVWNPLDHVPISATHEPLASGAGSNSSDPFDWFHMNAIQSFDGGYLINSRQTRSSYFINRQGDIEWELNGETGGSFGSLPQGYNFSWQHDARLHSGASSNELLYTVFNDYNGDFSTKNPSTGITLILNIPANNGTKSLQPYANLVDPANPLPALAEGSYQLLDNNTALLGYGVFPVIKEFDISSGTESTVKYSAQFAYENYTASSYRSLKYDWHAAPCAPVDLVIAAANVNGTTSGNATAPSYGSGSSSGKIGYVSWNGATDVTTYNIYAQMNGSADFVDTGYFFDKKGFETAFQVPTGFTSIQVVASADREELGRSSTVAV